MKNLISLIILTISLNVSAQFLIPLDLSRGVNMSWGGASALIVLDTAVHVVTGSSSRYNVDRTAIVNYFNFSGNDLGFFRFNLHVSSVSTRSHCLPPIGYLRTETFSDSLLSYFHDVNGNLIWTTKGNEKFFTPVGLTNDSFAIGSNRHFEVPVPGLVSMDMRQGSVHLLSYSDLEDSLAVKFSGLNAGVARVQGGVIDSSNIAHLVIRLNSKVNASDTAFLYLSVDKGLNIISMDTAALSGYYRFDREHFYKIHQTYDSLNQVSSCQVEVYTKNKTAVHQFNFQQNGLPESFMLDPVFDYKKGHLAVSNRIVTTDPVQMGMHPRFRLIDTTGATVYDRSLKLDTLTISRTITNEIRLDDSLNLYFTLSSEQNSIWHLGKITASGGIANPLGSPPERFSTEWGRLYPNPFSDFIRVEALGQLGFRFKLYNLRGDLVMECEGIGSTPEEFPTDFLKSGLYMYKVQREDGIFYMGKVLKR